MFRSTSSHNFLLPFCLTKNKLGDGKGTQATIKVYDGARGRNTLLDVIINTKSQLYTPVGSMVMIELRLLGAPPPEVLFSFAFQTGKSVRFAETLYRDICFVGFRRTHFRRRVP